MVKRRVAGEANALLDALSGFASSDAFRQPDQIPRYGDDDGDDGDRVKLQQQPCSSSLRPPIIHLHGVRYADILIGSPSVSLSAAAAQPLRSDEPPIRLDAIPATHLAALARNCPCAGTGGR